MAIGFEQPQPINTLIAQAYGAAEVGQRNNAIIADQAAQQARLSAANQQANYDRAARIDAQNYDRIQQGLDMDARLEGADDERISRERMQGLELAEQRNRAEFLAAQELQQIQARGQVQSWLMNQELSVKEEIDLKRKKQAAAEIAKDEYLSPQQKTDYIRELMTGINLDERRQRSAQTRMAEEHAKVYEQQAEQRKTVQLKTAALDAKTVPQRTVTIPLPEGGTAMLYQTGYDQNGDPTYTQLKADRPEKPEDPAKQIHPEFGMTFPEYAKEARKVISETTKWYDSLTPEEQKRYGDVGNQINAALDAARLPRTPQDFLAGMGQQRQSAAAPAAPQPTGFQGGGAPPPQPAPPPPPPGYRMEDQQPFSRMHPKTQTPVQQQMMKDYETLSKRAEKLDEPTKKAALRAIDRAEEILATYGHPSRIDDPEDRAAFDKSMLKLLALLPQALPEGATERRSASTYQPYSSPGSAGSGMYQMGAPLGR